jgi:hypothetical protein
MTDMRVEPEGVIFKTASAGEVCRVNHDNTVWINPEIDFTNLDELDGKYLRVLAGFCIKAAELKEQQ